MGKCCAGYCYDDYIALAGGSAAGRFSPPLAPSSTVTDQQIQTNCVRVRGFSPRGESTALSPPPLIFSYKSEKSLRGAGVNWTVPSRRPVLHSFNYALGSAWGNHMYEVTRADLELAAGGAF
jgi:hypothetical protein